MKFRSMRSVDTLSHGKTTTLIFSGVLESGEYASLKKKLVETIEKSTFVRIDFQNIVKIESLYLYMVLSLLKTLKEKEIPYESVRLSAELIDTLVIMGIEVSLFNKPLEREY